MLSLPTKACSSSGYVEDAAEGDNDGTSEGMSGGTAEGLTVAWTAEGDDTEDTSSGAMSDGAAEGSPDFSSSGRE